MDDCRASGARFHGALLSGLGVLSARRPRGVLSRAPAGARGSAGPQSPRCLGNAGDARPAVPPAAPALASRCPARAGRCGVSCDSWGAMFFLVTAVPRRNTPNVRSLAHLVCVGLGFPYI